MFSVGGNNAFAFSQTETDSLKRALSLHAERDTVQLKILLKLASSLRQSATSEALSYGKQALFLADSLRINDGKASALQVLGLICNHRADYRNSLFYSLQALRLYEASHNGEGMAFAYNALGIVYDHLKKYEIAKRYYLQSLHLMEQFGIEKDRSTMYCNLGNIGSFSKSYDESIYYYRLALDNANKFDDKKSVCRILLNLGELYYERGQPDSARYCFMQVLHISQTQTKELFTTAMVYFELGNMALQENRLEEAERYLHQAEKVAENGSLRNMLDMVYPLLTELYKKLGRYKLAFEYSMKHQEIKDAVYNETTVSQINELQETYQVEKRDREIQLLNQQQEIIQANATNEKLVRNFAIAGLVALLLIALALGRTIVLKQRVKNRILSEKNAIVEKDIIKLSHENMLAKYEAMKSKTDPHFLFNSLTTLSSLVMDDPKLAVKYIKKFSELFRIVLEIGDHQVVTMEKEMEVVNSYIYLQKVRFEDNLLVNIDLPDHLLKMNIPPFALQMVIENAVKHNIISQRHPFSLSVKEEDGFIIVRNTLQKKTSRVHSTSTGQKSVKERYRILCDKQPVFIETATEYIVKLPLLPPLEKPVFKEVNV